MRGLSSKAATPPSSSTTWTSSPTSTSDGSAGRRVPRPSPRCQCRRYAFAGIHNISPRIFGVFDGYGCPERFPIVDFYLRACAEHPIYGVRPRQLTLVDVGKLETLGEAERIFQQIKDQQI